MDIPSDDEFKDFIEFAGLRACSGVPRPSSELLDPVASAEAYFGECWEAALRHRREVQRHVVWQWLVSQSCFKRAMKSAASGGAVDPMLDFDRDRYVLGNTNPVLEMVASVSYLTIKIARNARWPDEDLEPGAAYWKHLNIRGKYWRPLRLYADLVSGLREYFYSPLPHGKSHTNEISRASDIILDTASRLDSEVGGLCRSMPLPSRCGSRLDGILRKLNALSEELLREQRKAYPTSRNDETAGERRLVWDLRLAFRREFNADKTTALSHLVQLDGIRRPPDKRAIERLLEGWRASGSGQVAEERS